ncbi:MAG: rod shape-determining protein MreC [bacterium]|nr:rod shape-determining protein MreC [bacterium]
MKRINIILILSAVFIILLLHYFGATVWIDNNIRKLFNKGSSVAYNLSISNGDKLLEFNSIEELKNGYQVLSNNYDKNVVDRVKLELLSDENKNLREQLNYFSKNNVKSIGAGVISRSMDVLRDTIVIDRGSQDGVGVNMPVITGGGFYVGKIKQVELDTSVVQLINDQYSKIAATILNKSSSIGVVEGGYGLSLQMNFIPQNEDIIVGEDVITSGLEEEIPYGLILGRIDIVEKEPYQPFQKAILSPYVDLNKIQTVSVLLTS